MATIAKLMVELGLEDNAFQRGIANSRQKLDDWGKSLRGIGTKLTAGVTTPLIAGGAAFVNWSSDLEQAIGKSEAVFGDASGSVEEWSKGTAKAFGFARSDAIGMAATYGSLFKVMDFSNDIAADYSMSLIGLSADMAAFNDVSNDRASEALMAGLTGEYMSLRSMGVFLNEAAVSQEALRIATAAGREEITDADKVQARYNLIMKQTAQQQGQAAREADGWASRLAQVKARVKDTGAAIGSRLMPYALKLLDAVDGLVGWFDKLNPAMQKWAIMLAVVAAAAGPVLMALGMLLPGLSALLAVIGFLVSPIGLIVLGIAALAAGAIYAYTHFEAFREAVDKIAKALLNFATNAIEKTVEAWNKLKDAFDEGGWSQLLATLSDMLLNGLQSLGSAILAGVQALGDWFWQGLKNVDWGGLLSTAWDVLSGAGSWLVGKLGDIVVALGTWIVQQVRGVDWPGAFQAGWDVLSGVGGWIVGKLGDIAISIGTWFYQQITGVNWEALFRLGIDVLKNAGVWALEAIGDLSQTLLTKGQDLLNGLWTGAKGVWEEVRTWIAGRGPQIVTALGDLTVTLAQQGMDLLNGLWTGAKTTWESVRTWIAGRAAQMVTALGDLTVTLLQQGMDLLSGLWNGAKTIWTSVSTWLSARPGVAVQAIGVVLTTLLQKGKDLFTGLWNGMIAVWSTISTWLGTIRALAVSAISDLTMTLYQKGVDLFTGLWNGVLSIWASFTGWLGGMGGMIADGVGNLSYALWNAGVQIVNGLIGGIKSMAGAAVNAAKGVVQDAINGAKNLLGINSPSKVFAWIGEMSIAGWVKSFDRHGKDMIRSVADTSRDVTRVPFDLTDALLSTKAIGSLRPSLAPPAETGQTTNNYYALTADDLMRVLRDSEAGGEFARAFGGELALRGGAIR